MEVEDNGRIADYGNDDYVHCMGEDGDQDLVDDADLNEDGEDSLYAEFDEE